MKLNPEKLLDRCYKGQWSVDDFDWNRTPEVQLSKEKEIQVCTYYLNMSYIERMAGALFLALSKRMNDPTLKAIYESFYVDELRHSHAAAKLMDYFDVHHYKVYTPSPGMLKFVPYFKKAVETLNPAIANHFVLGGELILDIALLRSLNDYVNDPFSRAVIDKVNSDESRHIAMDFYMTEYCSTHDMSKVEGSTFLDNLNLLGLVRYGPEFFRDVFFIPMKSMDPEQKQLKDVTKRLRRFYLRDEVQDNPVVKNFNYTSDMVETKAGKLVLNMVETMFDKFVGIDISFIRAGFRSNLALNQHKQIDDGEEALDRAMTG